MNNTHIYLLQVFFQLQPPTTMAALKARFRERCKELHPDSNPTADHHRFIEMKQAYDCLVEATDIFDRSDRDQKTIEGVYFSALGLGISDHLTNTTTCERCNGMGRVSHHSLGTPCYECSGVGYTYTYSCPDCRGTGVFFQTNAKKNVECRKCHGQRLLHFSTLTKCVWCNASGWLHNNKVVWNLCTPCHGTGEIEIFKPVIPKNTLTMAR